MAAFGNEILDQRCFHFASSSPFFSVTLAASSPYFARNKTPELDGDFPVRPEVIAYLLQGGTLRELGIPVSAFQHVRFAFDASRIAFDSPFFAKIRPYIPFEYDKKVGLGTLLSALSLIIALKGPVGPPTVHPEPAHPAKIGIEAIAKTRPSVSPSMVQVGQLFYQSTLGRADFAEIQRALYLAGFEPGAIDGQKGSRTKKAAEGLQKAGIAFKGYDDPAFLNALSLRLANKFPFFAQEP